MSESQIPKERDASPALGTRENFFDPDHDDYKDTDETPTGPRRTDVDRDWGQNHSFTRGRTKAEYVAHSLLKQSATILCPVTLHAPPDRGVEPLFDFLLGDPDSGLDHDPSTMHTERQPVELSAPEVHVPKSFPDGFSPAESGQYRLRRRFNEQYGYVTFGGKIANRPREEFLAVVDDLLNWIVRCSDNPIDRETADGIRSGAFDMKIDGQMDDTDIMENVIEDVLEEF